MLSWLALIPIAVQSLPYHSGPPAQPDGTIALQIDAPEAKRVSVWGDWMNSQDGTPMSKAASAWTYTTPRLSPGPHLYCFFVDGIRVADPRNRLVKNGFPGLSSVINVPSRGPAVETGVTHVHTFINGETRATRTFQVYTPARSGERARLPVLYLLHGSWDSDRDWLSIGQAARILEELVQSGKAKSMILVALDGHPYPSLEVSTRTANLRMLAAELRDVVIPTVERQYRPSRNRNHRAIAGLSMGGVQALHLAAAQGLRFGTVAAFSAPGDVFGGPKLLDAWKENIVDRAPQFWFACGSDDAFLSDGKLAHEQLRSLGLSSEWHQTTGGHEWATWREHLKMLLPTLFK